MKRCGLVADPGRFGFGRCFRLLRPQEFSAVFHARQVVRGERFALHFRENALKHPRLGLVLPKKQARSAVLRNAIKRQAREAFRLKRPGLPALDIVLRLLRPVAAIEKSVWRTEIEGLLDRLAKSDAKRQAEGVRERSPQ
ncbi:ribonuclease P protein component [Sulfuricystis thermophila]|uniref:ribonuclease P protein component n=1 Tax=Sulfuricystis thermophila TaxID=2496847 RepID=UPI0010363376|nr:ribonuclease P protein component [Sulfuricystis thermophila]